MEIKQRTNEWLLARVGFVTASRVGDVIAKVKSGYSSSRANYLAQLVSERLTRQPCGADLSNNPYVQHGIEQEPYARAAYESRANVLVDEVGFVEHPSIALSGASPDGLVGSDGLVEIKCPNTATHIDYLLGKQVPAKYKPQMAWQLACTKRKWCDFVSFDPRLPERHQLFIIRYEPEAGYIEELESEVQKFLDEVQETINKLEEC